MRTKRFAALFLALMLCLLLFAGCSASVATPTASGTAQPTTSAPQAGVAAVLPSFADMLDVVEHSVVAIYVRESSGEAAGSGWAIDSGTIITCEHVVTGATSITVTTIDGKNYTAQSIGSDATADIAVLRISGGSLPALKVADASKVRVGDWALAVGNPLGLGISAKEGIVSRLGVTVQLSATQTFNNLIETSALINPGNSGGPLVNLAGEVMGITSLKVTQSGIEGMGYAINMRDALPVDDLHGVEVAHRLQERVGVLGAGGQRGEEGEGGKDAGHVASVCRPSRALSGRREGGTHSTGSRPWLLSDARFAG